ncbi:MAG: succinylglutamate desuccinylase/aspartoacylase family protein [Myxococcota bacterium]
MERLPVGVHALWPNVTVVVQEAAEPGPTALVQAGIHGDEIGGVHALQEMLEDGLTPRAGRLLVVPVMNPPAYRARTRAAPEGLDLNRCFPGNPDAERDEPRLAARFMALIEAEQPALVATLHESQKRYDPAVNPSFGQTLVYGVDPCPPLLDQVVGDLNAGRESDAEAWATQYFPVATSSTEVIVDRIGCIGTCVETWMGFDLDRRVAMQREVVERLLERLGMPFAYEGRGRVPLTG